MDELRPSSHELDDARDTVCHLFAAALKAVDPEQAVIATLDTRDTSLLVGTAEIDKPSAIHLVAFGKAAIAMTRGAVAALKGIALAGDVITSDGHEKAELPDAIRVHFASHPIPDDRGVQATRDMLDGLAGRERTALVLALVSGGGSALLEAPRAGVSLTDLAKTTELLLRAGAPIHDLNAVRSPLSQVKAGGLRAAANDAQWVTLILSDVLGNDPRIIASGPTVPGTPDPVTALALIDRYNVRSSVPAAVLRALASDSSVRPPVRSDDDVLVIIGDNALAVETAANAARAIGSETAVVWRARQGEAADLGREFVSIVADVSDAIDVVLGGGEATVTVRGDGCGGRNTEFALAAASELERRGMRDWVIASLGTDGQDAMTGLAGAIGDAGTYQRARALGVDPDEALAENDSASVFEVAGGAVTTGPTGTNVNDLYIAVRMKTRERERPRGGD